MGRSIGLLKAGLTMEEVDSSFAFSSGQRVETASGASAPQDQVSVPRGVLDPQLVQTSHPADPFEFDAASELKLNKKMSGQYSRPF